MNEQRHNMYGYFNSEQNKKQDSLDELVSLIKMFISRNALSPKDILVLHNIIKQINAQQDNLSAKVIRSMNKKFQNIQNKYQNQK